MLCSGGELTSLPLGSALGGTEAGSVPLTRTSVSRKWKSVETSPNTSLSHCICVGLPEKSRPIGT